MRHLVPTRIAVRRRWLRKVEERLHIAAMGAEILTEDQYRELQQLGAIDTKTSSWILTPARVRSLGGALFCDRRFDTVFTYHNGAESYYAARGFRCRLRI